ncbi:prominin 1 [Paragonimus westermani]|uniref:Prominin 1 n=1 Tax=Paragonimus westermani TaxID=34504 RepID=A0A5J4NNA8_9TREM|nr:prominin 1 [Paragonimus westermani]
MHLLFCYIHVMRILHQNFWVFLLLSTSAVMSETTSPTILQLKESVGFSYSLTNLFLDLIRGERAITVAFNSYINVMSSSDSRVSFRSVEPSRIDRGSGLLRDDIQAVVVSYVGFGVCVVLGLLFAILMPLGGLVFCCARCCGKCGGRVQLMDSKKDPCKRTAYTIFVLLIVTIQLVAVVLAFINNFLLHEALVNPDPKIGALSQLNLSILETEQALREMFKMSMNTSSVNLDDQKTRFMSLVDGGLREFQSEFIRKSNANLVLNPIGELQNSKLKLFCDFAIRLLNESHISFQFEEASTFIDQLQRHQNELENLNEVSFFVVAASMFNTTVNGLADVVKRAIANDLDRAWTDLANSPSTREKLARSFEQYLNQIYHFLGNVQIQLRELSVHSNPSFLKLVEFSLYGGIALLCVPILILLLIYLGLCFGICGRRPYEEAGVCNRGVGANLLLAGVGFIFLFSTLLMVFCTVLFILGGPLQTEACRYLTGRVPDGPKKLDDYVHNSLQLLIENMRRNTKLLQQQQEQQGHEKMDGNISVYSDTHSLELALNISRARLTDAILTRCRNEPFVDAISGGQLTWPVLYEPIQAILEELISSFKGVNLIAPLSLTVQLCTDMLNRVDFVASANFSTTTKQMGLPLTYIDDLQGYLIELRSLQIPQLDAPISALAQQVVSLDRLRAQTRDVYAKLDSIPGLRLHLQQQLSVFSEHLATAVKITMDVGLKKLRPLLERELQLAVIATWRDIPCYSLHVAAKRSVDAVCVTTLMPLNAFWAGLGLALWLFIPLIVFAVKLASLYRKTEKYSSDYEEPDYISYQGFYMRPSSDYQVAPQ